MKTVNSETVSGRQICVPALESRFDAICSIAEIGDYYYEFDTHSSFFSEFLYKFYEIERNFNIADLLDAGFYSDVERAKLLKMTEQARLDGICSEGEFKITLPDGRIKWHYSFIKPIVNDAEKITGIYGCLQNITAKKEAEINEARTKLYNSILEKLPAQVAAFDTELRCLFVNEGAIRDSEKRKLFIGKTNSEYFSLTGRDPHTGDERDRKMRECLTLKKPVMYEEKMIIGTNEQIYFRIFQPVFTDEGDIDYGLEYGIDITELKHIQNVNTQQRVAIDKAMNGIALLDENGNYTYMNPSHTILFGYSDSEELLGKSWRALYSESEIVRIENSLFPELMKSGSWSGETIGLKKDGTSICQEISLTSLENGGLLCICRDVTKRKEQELELKRLAVVAERSNSIVMITDANRKIEWVNDSFVRTFKYSLEEVIGKDPGRILQGLGTSSETIKEISAASRNGLHYAGEILNYTKDNQSIWLYIDITPIFDNQGGLTNFVAVEHDITIFKNAEAKLVESIEKERQLNRFKSEFVQTVSHQFRTPLAAIQSSLDILELKSSRESFYDFTRTFKKHKATISLEAERMTELMNNILDLGRLDEGRIEFKPETIDLKSFIIDFLESDSEHNMNRKVKFLCNTPDVVMNIDKVLMKNVLHNILSNAFKYSEDNLMPELTVTICEDFCLISVRDFGIGIPVEEQKYIFQSFFRASNAQSKPGTGLGLLIAKRMLGVMGGGIEIFNEATGGCNVLIKLPLD